LAVEGIVNVPRKEFEIRAVWDDEAGVWYIAESDLPGLAAEGATLEALHDKLATLIPELVELNKHLIDWEPDGDFPVHFTAERTETFHIPS
jgi:predicted RNase H-like HicB family nuclease